MAKRKRIDSEFQETTQEQELVEQDVELIEEQPEVLDELQELLELEPIDENKECEFIVLSPVLHKKKKYKEGSVIVLPYKKGIKIKALELIPKTMRKEI